MATISFNATSTGLNRTRSKTLIADNWDREAAAKAAADAVVPVSLT